MKRADYKKALHSARAEFNKLLQERAELDTRIVRLKQTIAGLVGLCEVNSKVQRALNQVTPLPPRFMRLTSAIRQLLAQSGSAMRPPELRDALVKHGFTLAQYANKLAVIHNTLTRLEKQGEVIQVPGGWILTDKGRLAAQMDSLDFTSPEGSRRSQ
ncbi:MAG TPA: hypothetical protein VKY31_15780 [Terriglobia bacterium]|nr:hypothetical protein [Terriglobia bacterium]